MHFTEANYENAILELFNKVLGYERVKGSEVERDYSQPLHIELKKKSDIVPMHVQLIKDFVCIIARESKVHIRNSSFFKC